MNTNTETMSPADALARVTSEMRQRRVNHGKHTSPTLEKWAGQIDQAVAALIEERDNSDKYGWTEGPPPFPYGQEWFLADTGFGPVILRSLTDEYSYDYTTADHTHILREKVERWMQLPESDFIAYLSSGQIRELRAERGALIAERDALKSDAITLRAIAEGEAELCSIAKDELKALEAERDALAELHAAVLKHGEWDDGCFYYAGRSASELQHALSIIDKVRAEARHG